MKAKNNALYKAYSVSIACWERLVEASVFQCSIFASNFLECFNSFQFAKDPSLLVLHYIKFFLVVMILYVGKVFLYVLFLVLRLCRSS